MNRLIYTATIAVAVIVSTVGAHAWTLFTTDKIAPPAPAASAPSSIGRYVLYLSPLNARDVFMLDTETGRIWQRTIFNDLQGQPVVWDYMDRIDDPEQLRAYITAQGGVQRQKQK